MSQNAAPQPGDVYLLFNGIDSYVEIPSIVAYSVANNSALTVSAWIRPDVVNFPNFEGTHYVHWMGKGEGSGTTGQQEWALRMYNRDGTQEDPPRPNRISFYVFNLEGGLGVGSYVQDTVRAGDWIYIVGVADDARTYLYRDGAFSRCSTYRGAEVGGCPIQTVDSSTGKTQVVINPQMGSSPLRLGTRDFASFFEGGMTRVRIWSRVLIVPEILELYQSDTVPQDGLVAEFRLDSDTGSVAADSAQGNDGIIVSATWATQQ
jgi:hypothetical protein